MKQTFDMSDLGLLTYYLGMEVRQRPDEITICQKAYATKIVESLQMENCNPSDTPMEQRFRLTATQKGTERDEAKYRSIIGSLRYLVNTRPDICFAVGLVSRFMEAPGKEHWVAVKRIIRYLAGTLDYGVKLKKGEGAELSLLGYTDSDCSGDLIKRSTSGILFFLDENLVTWTSQKQKIVALSSCEAEYVSAALGACQGVWLSMLMAGIMNEASHKFRLLIDNMSAIELSKNPVFHDRSKHIEKKLGRGGKDRPPGIPYKKRPKQWSRPRKSPNLGPPITNGPASTVHSATAQPEGGAQDIVPRERTGHSEGIFLTKPENSLPIGIEPRTWRCYSEVLNR
jgi:hypothetical protein